MRGGQVIDFLVMKDPLPVPVYVQGTYWHTGRHGIADTLKQAEVENAFAGTFDRIVNLEESETMTEEGALQAVKVKIGIW